MRPWIVVAYSTLVVVITVVFLINLIGQWNFSNGMPLGLFGTFNFMIVFQVEYIILMHPFHTTLGKDVSWHHYLKPIIDLFENFIWGSFCLSFGSSNIWSNFDWFFKLELGLDFLLVILFWKKNERKIKIKIIGQ